MPKLPARKAKKKRSRKPRIPGAAPGTLQADPSSLATSMELIAYGPDQVFQKKDATPGDGGTARGTHAVTWMHVTGLGNVETLKALGEIFGIHRLALEDVLNDSLRPRFEAYDPHFFVSLRSARTDDECSTEQLSLVFGDNWV
ncbi:MAG: hypothetical protein IT285_05440, partial [Bdellovibrionales bacterium]|nr:hypothetical protein [Bdellovibrionales bacterium]